MRVKLRGILNSK